MTTCQKCLQPAVMGQAWCSGCLRKLRERNGQRGLACYCGRCRFGPTSPNELVEHHKAVHRGPPPAYPADPAYITRGTWGAMTTPEREATAKGGR